VSPPRTRRRFLTSLVLLALAVVVVGRVHLLLLDRAWPARAAREVDARAASFERNGQALVASLAADAARVAAWPETRAALAGNTPARSSLFRILEGQAQDGRALAVHGTSQGAVAWGGRLGEPASYQGFVGEEPDVFVLSGTVATSLVATTPVRGPDGRLLGGASASITLAVRRHIRNEFVSDFDRLAGAAGGMKVHYVDVRETPIAPAPPLPAPPDRVAVLRSPGGSLLATARVSAPALEETRARVQATYRRALSLVGTLLIVAWALGGAGWRRRTLVAALGLRGLLLVLGPPLPLAGPLTRPDTYASALLGPLLRSPLDLLLTAAVLLVMAVLAAEHSFTTARRLPAVLRITCLGLTVASAMSAIGLVGDTVANCALDLEVMSLLPQSVAHLIVQTALLMVLAAGLLGSAAFFRLAASPSSALGGLALAGLALGVAAAAVAFWPATTPPAWAPSLLLVALALAPVLASARLGTRARAASPGGRAVMVLLGVAILAGILYPLLVDYASRNTRVQVMANHAPLVLRQPEWREFVLASTRARIDSLNVLEAAPPGPVQPDIEELAFAVWSATDLAALGFSSAVEIQDPKGAVVSRFALNLPSLMGPDRPLPASDNWEVSRERLSLASTGTSVLHARRLLRYRGELRGAIHAYVAEDYWNLPFVRGRDPYSVLYRTAPPQGTRERPVALVVYDREREVVFSSAERPPELKPDLAQTVPGTPDGLWTTLPVDGAPHDAFLFPSGREVMVLAFPRRLPARYAAELVEAASTFTVIGLGVLVALVLARTALGRSTLTLPSLARSVEQRFALRLFVAFTALAVVPVAVLQVVVSGFVAGRLRKESEDQALERVQVAQKAVEDYAFFQRGEEGTGSAPVTDAALVWLASVIRNDLDVFVGGRLLASSQRELYASGLIPPRVAGDVYRALVLGRQPWVLRTERIGDFSYQVVSAPVHLDAPEHGILSIPLALRQREVEATVADLDRTIRLASVVFLALAALLAHSMARRISGPISDLTGAARRIAQGDLAARVTSTSRDELQRLVEAFNQMAGDLLRQRSDLERSNRLAAWAEMARQVAHEVKNPLTPIQLSTEHLRRVWGDRDVDFGHTLEVCTETILKQVRILRRMVTEFSAFARPPAAELERVSPLELVREAVRPYQVALPPGVKLTVELPAALPDVLGDRRLLERALVNLLENALQAVGDDGRIAVGAFAAGDGHVNEVRISVEDSGAGIPADIMERIFEPFFSTKTTGSGLGLALVKKIAEDHGGGVALETGPGRPTRAVLWIPAAPPTPDTGTARPSNAGASS
jgi:signal transduction histidine kinase